MIDLNRFDKFFTTIKLTNGNTFRGYKEDLAKEVFKPENIDITYIQDRKTIMIKPDDISLISKGDIIETINNIAPNGIYEVIDIVGEAIINDQYTYYTILIENQNPLGTER